MNNVCIVDDNRAELKVIAKAVERYVSPDLNVIAQFTNGKDAYDYIKNNDVDIVITDIQMPRMTGMELIRRLRTENYSFQAIVVSCYDDFKYAREAIDLDIIAYVLKPISESELHMALKKAITKNDKNHSKVFEGETNVVEMHRLRNLLTDEREGYRFSKLVDIPDGFYVRVAALKIDEFAICEKNIFDMLENISGIIEAMGKDNIKFHPVKMSNNELALIIVYVNDEILLECINTIIGSVDEEFGLGIKMGVSERGDCKNLAPLYTNSVSAMEETVLCRNVPVLFYEDVMDLEKTSYVLPKPSYIQNELRELLKKQNTNAMVDFFDKYIGTEVHYTMGYIKKFAFCVINSIEIIMNENYTSFDDVFENHTVWDKLDKLEDVENIYNFLINLLSSAITIIEEEKKDRNYAIVEKIKSIIAAKYHKRLTVESIAIEIGFSAKHTQRMFIKATGSTILDYLTLYRMERAKENLENGGKISVTAEAVGYKNKAHFSNVFKKYTGLSPAEYKMNHSKQ